MAFDPQHQHGGVDDEDNPRKGSARPNEARHLIMEVGGDCLCELFRIIHRRRKVHPLSTVQYTRQRQGCGQKEVRGFTRTTGHAFVSNLQEQRIFAFLRLTHHAEGFRALHERALIHCPVARPSTPFPQEPGAGTGLTSSL